MTVAAEIHDEWVGRYLATVDKRFKPSDSPDAHMYNVDLDANGAELDEFFDAVEGVDSVTTAGAFGFQVTNVVTAAGKHHVNAPDPDWDESKVKRDNEGKFAKKAGNGLSSLGKVKMPAKAAVAKKAAAKKTSTVGTGQVAVAAKPLSINTKVIYTQKYDDGAVVAVKPKGTGLASLDERIIWNASTKKFERQRDFGSHLGWKTVDSYGKGEAYKQFSKESGWFAPDSTLPTLSTPTATITPTWPTGTPSGYFGKPILSVGDFKDAAWAEKVGWLKAVGSDELDVFSVYGLEKLEQQVHEMYLKGDLSGPDYQSAADKISAAKLKKTGGASVPIPLIVVNEMTEVTAPNLDQIMNMTPEEWNKLTPVEKVKINDAITDFDTSGLLSDRQISKYHKMVQKADDLAKVQIGYDVTDGDELVKEIDDDLIAKLDKMDPGQFLTWFNDNVETQDDFETYSDTVQKHLKTLALGTKEFFGIHGPANKIDSWTTPDVSTPAMPTASPTSDISLPDIAFLQHMTPFQFNAWFGENMDESMWNSLSDKEKSKLSKLANKAHADNILMPKQKITEWSSTGRPTTPDAVYSDQVVKTAKSMSKDELNGWFDNGGINKSTWDALGPLQQNAIKDEVDSKNASLAMDYIKTWEIKNFTPNDLSGVSYADIQEIEANIEDLTDKGFLSGQDALYYLQVKKAAASLASGGTTADITSTIVPTPTPKTPVDVTIPAPSSASVVTGSKYHVDVHSKITPISDIGSPHPVGPNTTFHVMSPLEAVEMQKYMLNVHNKKITPAQVAAVKRYTTSIGYRSTNGVLRDDTEQLKKISESDQKKGVQNAVDLQTAMSPITANVRVFRGTGAHAFGQKGIHANFGQLKKLEGKTLTDKGFFSTTVLAQPPVSYDYAKKPIQMIVDVPAGSPAAYVSALTPDWSTENELILGAGSSYRIKEVREATELDKKQFANPSLEHVVHVEIVPSTGKTSHKITTPTDVGKTPKPKKTAGTAATSLPLVTPTAAVKPTIGQITPAHLQLPMKMTTTVIHKNKYQHGAVVAYRKNDDGSLSRLFWNASTKKFILQNQDETTGLWTNFAGYGKGEAYLLYGKDDSWFTPPPGDSAFSAAFTANVPSISNPLPTSAAPALTPVTSTKVVKKKIIDVALLQAMHGDVSAPEMNFIKDEVFKDFKKGFGYNTHLGTPPEFVFDKLLQVHKKWSSGAAKPNLLQILRIADEKSTPAGATNEHKYEQKIVDWLKTPAGKTSALDQLNAPTPVPGALPKGAVVSPTGEISHAVQPHSAAVQAVLDTVAKPSSIGAVDLSDTSFKSITATDAKKLHAKSQAVKPWTTSQKNALRTYTGSQYREINGILRNDPTHISHLSESSKVQYAELAKSMQAGMRPLTQSLTLYRKTGTKQLPGLGTNAKFEDVQAFEGKTFIDRGFFSSSVSSGTWSGNLQMTLEVAKGVPVAWVKQISQNPGEDEMILAAGLKYRVISVTKGYGYVINMKLRVEV